MNFSLFLDIKIANLVTNCNDVEFDFTNKYVREKRSEYQKTKIRKDKRASIIKFYTWASYWIII